MGTGTILVSKYAALGIREVKSAEGPLLKVYCACAKSDSYRLREAFPPPFVKLKFEQRGWAFEHQRWLCPDCQRRQKEDKKMKPTPLPATGGASPGTEPTLKEVRAINELLERNFSEKDGRYLNGYSDQRIADELHLPRIKISRVREEAFGSLKMPAELSDLQSQLTAIKQMVGELEQKLAAATRPYGVR